LLLSYGFLTGLMTIYPRRPVRFRLLRKSLHPSPQPRLHIDLCPGPVLACGSTGRRAGAGAGGRRDNSCVPHCPRGLLPARAQMPMARRFRYLERTGNKPEVDRSFERLFDRSGI